ncbi:MAG: peptidase, partial [Gemmiger qucibialis]
AQALLMVQKAKADSIRLINEAAPSQNMLALRSMEAMEKMADGQATKIIVPSEMQNLAATVAAIKES